MEDDDDVDKWVKIEQRYLKGELPDGGGDDSKAKRKPFAKNDFKAALWTSDRGYQLLGGSGSEWRSVHEEC